MHHKHPKHKKHLKKKATWDEPIEKAQPLRPNSK
jgi:hypothetical protein